MYPVLFKLLLIYYVMFFLCINSKLIIQYLFLFKKILQRFMLYKLLFDVSLYLYENKNFKIKINVVTMFIILLANINIL